MDSMCVGVVLISLMGLFGVTKGSKRIMNLYFSFVVVFIAFQGLLAIRGYLTGESWVQNVLDLSWDAAYDSNPELIKDLQREFNCQGFNDQDDRSLELPLEDDEHLPPCSEVLEMSFGKRIKKLASVILCIRLIQLAGVFLLSILFKYLAAMDREEQGLDEEQDIKLSGYANKDGYYSNEKREEQAIEKVPLLSLKGIEEEEEEETLFQYYIQDIYVDGESGSEDGDHSDYGSDHILEGYSTLPDYEEEQEEIVSVHVA
ncbi:hypothetical protein BGZ49_004319 [Haplosporangium sp. Z 27]|nr:hypothetical protein BGZ49_004319 [Haplosporangium sp. Z 27]